MDIAPAIESAVEQLADNPQAHDDLLTAVAAAFNTPNTNAHQYMSSLYAQQQTDKKLDTFQLALAGFVCGYLTHKLQHSNMEEVTRQLKEELKW